MTQSSTDSSLHKAAELADEIWASLDDVMRETNLTDAWYSAAEFEGRRIIDFGAAIAADRISTLEAALEPFASESSRYGEYGDGSQRAWLNCTVADLRAARSALQSEKDREGGE